MIYSKPAAWILSVSIVAGLPLYWSFPTCALNHMQDFGGAEWILYYQGNQTGKSAYHLLRSDPLCLVFLVGKWGGKYQQFVSLMQMPAILDWFGWCTWDAFYTEVNPQGIKDGLKRLILFSYNFASNSIL